MISIVKDLLATVTTLSHKERLLGAMFLLAPFAVHAQTWNEDFLNQPFNLSYESQNPTRIADNATRDFAVGHVGYAMSRGSYHAIEQSSKANDLSAYIGGLRHIGRVDVQGHLRYRNLQDKEQAWTTALWNFADNPFMICDTIPGDASTETFDMKATAAYAFNNRLRGGLEIGLSTGSRADQNDPRPRTTTSVIPINAGVDYLIGAAWRIGLSAGIRVFSSGVDYTITQLDGSKYYYTMKGMGDYQRYATNNYSSYHRDFKGLSYRGALSAAWRPEAGRWADFLEVDYSCGDENARDGSTSYEFKGGDYSQTVLTATDRLQLRANSRTLHNLTVAVRMLNGKGTWFDQKRETDFEHGNIQYYRVLGSSLIHKAQRFDATLGYQLDLLRDDQRDLWVGATAGMHIHNQKHILGEATPKQNITTISIDVNAGKDFRIRRASLKAQLSGGYRHPLTKDYASGYKSGGAADISASYTRPVFEYETSSNAHIGALVDASLPVGKKLIVGLQASLTSRLYTDKEEYWQGFDGHSYTTTQFGAYLKF